MTEPLVALDPSGHATILSYDVPEPMSYSGRNFIDLALPGRAFRGIGAGIVTPAASLTQMATTPGARAEQVHAAPLVLAPPGVSVAMTGEQAAVTSSRPLSPRLAELRASSVQALVAGGRQLVVFPTTMGRLDYRIVDRGTLAPSLGRQGTDGGDGDTGGDDRSTPAVYIAITTPTAGTLQSNDSKLHVTVAGTSSAENVSGVAMTLAVDGATPVPIVAGADGSGWQADLDITLAGTHTLTARISADAVGRVAGNRYKVRDESSVTFAVSLGTGGGDGALPAVTISSPRAASTVYGEGTLTVPIKGTALGNPGADVTSVRVADSAGEGEPTEVTPDAATGVWQIDLAIEGSGTHVISAVAVDGLARVSPPASVTVTVTAEQPRRRIIQRLMIVETLNISSFLGSFGAGRVLKTFSLLPGEKATISLKTWTKTSESTKQGSSILDSSATDSESSWEDSLAKEQTSKESLTEATNYKISADVGATWGWGHADVHGEYSGSANSTREGAVKNVTNALQKHSLTASTNRTVTINSEYTVSTEAGTEESTTREISNINVSRVLNFVFRQMNQEHVILVHLTNVRVAFYAEDLLLGPDGATEYVHSHPDDTTSPLVPHIITSYDEVSLADLQDLLDRRVLEVFQQGTITGIKNALSGVPDHDGNLHEVFEVVVPKKDGVDVPEATYLRFPSQLRMSFEHDGSQFAVPGVILATDTVVMRTDAVVADTILGAGDALDEYSHGLQDVVVAERQSQLAQQTLALRIIQDSDAERAALYAKLFPPPVVPATTTTTSTTPGT